MAWFGLEASESIIMTIAKVGIELIGQLKTASFQRAYLQQE